jgi:hypothetical protein
MCTFYLLKKRFRAPSPLCPILLRKSISGYTPTLQPVCSIWSPLQGELAFQANYGFTELSRNFTMSSRSGLQWLYVGCRVCACACVVSSSIKWLIAIDNPPPLSAILPPLPPSIRHPFATSAIYPYLILTERSLICVTKWPTISVHGDKPGNIYGPFGHFFGHPL